MCGIVGVCGEPHQIEAVVVEKMSAALRHRGPDDKGNWENSAKSVAFGFRRLAILDLTAEGHQPMHSISGRYSIVFNGEIYNFQQIRRELEKCAYHFRGGSDTEVILAGLEQWGLVELLPRLNGMFAMAIWDERARVISLVRDRVGKKPLYYGWQGNHFFFCSELKAVMASGLFNAKVSVDGLSQYFERGYISAPLCIYEDLFKLIPGTYISLFENQLAGRPAQFSPYADLSQANMSHPVGPKHYWQIPTILRNPPFTQSIGDALVETERLIQEAVSLRLVSDVPVGALLSGGIDSSLVVSIMQRISSEPVKTFCIGFEEREYDESTHARSVAQYLGTDHSELMVSEALALSVIEDLPNLFDEPLCNASQIPTYLISRYAKQSVSVVLNGDGGDELFLGYNRYVYPEKILGLLSNIPFSRFFLKKLADQPRERRDKLAVQFCNLLPVNYRPSRPREAVAKLIKLASLKSLAAIYDSLIHYYPPSVILGRRKLSGAHLKLTDIAFVKDFAQRVSALEIGTYLSEDLLAKADRASMAVSLESRSPLLDFRLVEFAMCLPRDIRMAGGERKYLLRKLLSRYMPEELYERPKVGFTMPVSGWIRGKLKGWSEERLRYLQSHAGDLLDFQEIQNSWLEHQSGRADRGNELWCALTFSMWLERWRPKF